jgi:hypothetical protein
MQGIQNLMGFVADTHDLLAPHTHLLNPNSFPFLLLTLTLLPLLILISLPSFPVRTTCLFLGLAPLAGTHPWVRRVSPGVLHLLLEGLKTNPLMERIRLRLGLGHENDDSGLKHLRMLLTRLMDDDRLSDVCWTAEMREVELFENERFAVGPAGGRDTGEVGSGEGEWGKACLRIGERSAWTRGRDGWSGVGKDGGVRSVVFSIRYTVARFFFRAFFLCFFVFSTPISSSFYS